MLEIKIYIFQAINPDLAHQASEAVSGGGWILSNLFFFVLPTGNDSTRCHERRFGNPSDESKGQRLRMKSFWCIQAIAHVYTAL